MDGYYHRNQNISSSWDHRFSSAYDYPTPRSLYLDRRGSAPSGKYSMMSGMGGGAGFYGSGGGGALSDGGADSATGDNSRTNLIVNYLPQCMTEKDLYAMFASFGPVESCRVMKDFKTGYSYGFGFVNFVREDDAAAAIASLNGFSVQNKRLKVSYARPSGDDIKETNLYVTNLPRDITDHRLEVIFGKYGRIVQKHILRDKVTGLARGVAFVRYDKREEAQEAISALNNVIPEGGSEPLSVKIAEEHGKQKAAYYAGWSAGYQQNRGDVPWGFDDMDMCPPYPPVSPPPDYYNMPFGNDFPGQNGGFPRKPMGRGMRGAARGLARGAVRGTPRGARGRGLPWNSSGEQRFKAGGRNRNIQQNFW